MDEAEFELKTKEYETALADIKYIDSNGATIEAYQITDKTRWQDEGWPNWLVKQRGKGQMNCVYTDASAPDSLFIELEGGGGQLGQNAWIILTDGGSLAVMGEIEFPQFYNKVVPLPPKPVMQADDGKSDQDFYDSLDAETIEKLGLKNPADSADTPAIIPEPVPVELPSDEPNDIQDAIMFAIEKLKDGSGKAANEARDELISTMLKRVQWCNCPPGQCENRDPWGCRQHSPLV